MKFVLFYHSLLSSWNHGNAHFLRGVTQELLARGHDVEVYEPREGWSLTNERSEKSRAGRIEADFARCFPELRCRFYNPARLSLDRMLDGADVVLVHEWNPHSLVARIGRHRAAGAGYRLLFHDTHHRAVTKPESMAAYDLTHYDGVLAFGQVLRDLYLEQGWTARAWTWHEAADTRLFRPLEGIAPRGDLVWIGNWGDDERTAELHEFLLEPCRRLKLQARVHGVRYPRRAKTALREAGIAYGGFAPNEQAPAIYALHRVTMHVPRRPYVAALPGIPTIRVFEALACGIPLVSAPWNDCEGLFTPDRDFLTVRNGREMTRRLREVLADDELDAELRERGLATVRARHTCAHRAEELLAICRELGVGEQPRKSQAATVRSSRHGQPRSRKQLAAIETLS